MVKTLRPLSLGEISDERLRKLRTYAQAVVKPCFEHCEEGLMRPEELVSVFAAAADYVQLSYVMNTDKLPTAGLAKDVFEKVFE